MAETIREYHIIRELGRGAMGVVYEAEHVHLKEPRVLKRLPPDLAESPEFVERFGKEARLQSQLDHPNIVRVLDFFEEDHQFYLVMARAQGATLDRVLKKYGRLKPSTALQIIKGVLRGLNAAHAMGIVHRDVKPANIIVGKGGAKITDFGIAVSPADVRFTRVGASPGTPVYMSPEQIARPEQVDHRTDVYCAGIVLYEMLTGAVPFDGETDYEIQEQHLRVPMPDPGEKVPDIPRRLTAVLRKALEKDPDARFDGCGAFLKALESLQSGATSPQRVSEPGKPCPKCGTTNPASAAECAGCGIIFSKYRQQGPGTQTRVETASNPSAETSSPQPYDMPPPPLQTRQGGSGWLKAALGFGAAAAAVILAVFFFSEDQGTLAIQSQPGKAEVYIDGLYEGVTPLEISVPAGEYRITLQKVEYRPKEMRVLVQAGENKPLSCSLTSVITAEMEQAEEMRQADLNQRAIHTQIEQRRSEAEIRRREAIAAQERLKAQQMQAEMERKQEEEEMRRIAIEEGREAAREASEKHRRTLDDMW